MATLGELSLLENQFEISNTLTIMFLWLIQSKHMWVSRHPLCVESLERYY